MDDNDVEIAFDDTDSDVDEADDDDEEANGWRMYMRQRNPEPDVDAYSSVDEEEEEEGDEDRETFDTQLPTRHSVRLTRCLDFTGSICRKILSISQRLAGRYIKSNTYKSNNFVIVAVPRRLSRGIRPPHTRGGPRAGNCADGQPRRHSHAWPDPPAHFLPAQRHLAHEEAD